MLSTPIYQRTDKRKGKSEPKLLSRTQRDPGWAEASDACGIQWWSLFEPWHCACHWNSSLHRATPQFNHNKPPLNKSVSNTSYSLFKIFTLVRPSATLFWPYKQGGLCKSEHLDYDLNKKVFQCRSFLLQKCVTELFLSLRMRMCISSLAFPELFPSVIFRVTLKGF